MSITTKLGVVEIIIKGSKGDKGDISSITVINNLTSDSTTDPLAAAQGTELKNLHDTLDLRVDALEQGGSTIDQTARDSAASAQATADNNEAAILNNILEINNIDARLTSEENKEVIDATARADIASNDLEIVDINTRVTSLENAPAIELAINDLTDVNAIASDNQVLTYNEETGEWNAEYSTTALGITQFSYKMQLPSTTIPDPKFLSKDVEDPSLVTMLYINKNDDAGQTDLTLFLENIRAGDWLNIFDKQDSSNFESYDVIGDVVLNGDIFEVPVVVYESTSTISANTKIRLFWRRYSYNLDLENLDQRVTDAESAIINNTLEINSIDLRVDALELDNTAIDQAARDAAAAAQSTADINTGDISSLDTRLTNEENKEIIDTIARGTASAADLKAEATNDRLNDLGEFTGTIITDNSSLETALQDLETSLENVAGGGSIDSIARQGVNDNTDSIDLLDTRLTNEENKTVIDSTARTNAALAQNTADSADSKATSALSIANAANGKADVNTSDISSLDSRVSSSENSISSNDTDITNLQGRVTTLEESGGGTPGGGSFPEETIIKSTVDLSNRGYKSLAGNATFDKIKNPINAARYTNGSNVSIVEDETISSYDSYRKKIIKFGNFFLSSISSNQNDFVVLDSTLTVSSTVLDVTSSIDNDALFFERIIGVTDNGIIINYAPSSQGLTQIYCLSYYTFNMNAETPQEFLDSRNFEFSLQCLAGFGTFTSSNSDYKYSSYVNNDNIVIIGGGNTANEYMYIKTSDFIDYPNTNDNTIFKMFYSTDDLYLNYINTFMGKSKTGKALICNDLKDYFFIVDIEAGNMKKVMLNGIADQYSTMSYYQNNKSCFINNHLTGYDVYDTDTGDLIESGSGSLYYYGNIGNATIGFGAENTQSLVTDTITHYKVNGVWRPIADITTGSYKIITEIQYYNNPGASLVPFGSQTDEEIFLVKSDGNITRFNLLDLNSDTFTVLAEPTAADKSSWIKEE